jgi:nucleotide-binding universal stress UspA family protein
MRVLVATDLSAAADVALAMGASLASTPGGALAAIHVLPAFHTISILDERATLAVREHVDRAAGRVPELFVEEGSAVAEILKRAEAWHADLVVVGSHGHSGLTRILGSVAEKVVRYARCDVLVARVSDARGWVLAATDLSDPSLPAITAGAAEARRRGARLEVVHAIGFLDIEASYMLELSSPTLNAMRPARDPSDRALAEAVARAGVEAKCAILDNPPAAAIVREAEAIGAELIVVGARGKTGHPWLALGSVAEKVVRAASCSVLAVHALRPLAERANATP